MSDQTNLPADVAAPSPPAISKAGMSPGGAIAALVPQSLDDAFRLAKALSASGDMVPKHFQGKPEATMAAIVRGMEVGLAPMQALANIAVINGRASIWGDAIPALLQRAGHMIDSEVSGEGDARKATATLTRADGRTIVRTFSVGDAKKAGLWGKQGPWQQYPDRMLANRARAFAARDGAADALMGLQVAEEVSDYAMKDVTPDQPQTRLQRLAAAARQPASQAAEAEVLPADDMDQRDPDEMSGDDVPDVQIDRTPQERAAFDEGYAARGKGVGRDAGPYPPGELLDAWVDGHDIASAEAMA